MPFTPAHSAIVLPFIRINPRFVSATGLIVGSVTPDFEYFFKMSVSGVHGHTLWGLLYFDLPVATGLALVFHLIVKRNLINNTPSYFQKKFRILLEFDFLRYLKRNYPAFIVSALIGSLSHIFWDGFTHSAGFFVNELPFYRGAYVPFEGVDYPLWYALQHISTFVGLTTLIVYFILMDSAQIITIKPSITYWSVLLFVTALVILIRFNFNPIQADIGNFVVSSISALCVAVIVGGMLPLLKRMNG